MATLRDQFLEQSEGEEKGKVKDVERFDPLRITPP